MSAQIDAECLRDYGVTADAFGAHIWERVTRPPRKIESAAQYVGVCRAMARGREYLLPSGDYAPIAGEGRIDGRIVAVGFNRESPTRWVGRKAGDGPVRGLVLFLEYWVQVAERPHIVGSSCNRIEPEAAYRAMRAGVPAHVVRVLGSRAVRMREPETRIRRLPRRRIRRLLDAARAAGRTSLREEHEHRFSTRALAALGRLCPELQRVAIEAMRARLESFDCPTIRVRDIPWDEVARVQRQLAADTSGRLRAAIATGKRRESLYRAAVGPEPRLGGPCVRLPELGERLREWRCSCESGCHDCSREVTSVALIDEDEYTRRYDVTRERLPDPSGERRPYATRETVQVSTGRARPPSLAEWLAPSYPRVSIEQAARLARGETPAQLAGGGLSSREAHHWLSTAPQAEPIAWLCRGLPDHTPPVRSFATARWLFDVQRRGAWGALTRERQIVGPGGATARVRYLDRVDEVQDVDLDRGANTGVERAFDRAAARCGEAWLSAARADHRVLRSLPTGWRLYRCMRHLATPAELVREGDELQHCVGGYVPAVESGQSVIVGIDVLGYRSTVELTPDGAILQHRGPQNTTPHPLCARVIDQFLRRRTQWPQGRRPANPGQNPG